MVPTLLISQLLQCEVLLNTSAQDIVAFFWGSCALHDTYNEIGT
jgi:hypothetical protein